MRKFATWLIIIALSWFVWHGVQKVGYELERTVSVELR